MDNLDDLFKVISSFEEHKKECERAISEANIEVVNCYHILEMENLDAVAITKVTKRLRTFLRKRRDAKNEHRFYASLEAPMSTAKAKIYKTMSTRNKAMEEYHNRALKSLEEVMKNDR